MQGVVKGGGDGNATFVPNLYIYDDADDEQPYVPISCLLTDCNVSLKLASSACPMHAGLVTSIYAALHASKGNYPAAMRALHQGVTKLVTARIVAVGSHHTRIL